MPSQQGTSRFAIRAGIIGVVGLGLTIGLMILMLKLAGTSTEIDVRLGDVDFRGIVADDLAEKRFGKEFYDKDQKQQLER